MTKLCSVIYTVVTANLFYHKWFALVIVRRENEMNENDKQIRKLTKRSVIIAVLALALVLALVIGLTNIILPMFETQRAREPEHYIGSLCVPEQTEDITAERTTEISFSKPDEQGNRKAEVRERYYLKYEGEEPTSLIIAYPVLNFNENEAFEMTVNGVVVNAKCYGACSTKQFAEARQKDIIEEKLENGVYFESAFPEWPKISMNGSAEAPDQAVVYYAYELRLEPDEPVDVEICFTQESGSAVSFISGFGDVRCKDHDFSIENIDLM
ncbi:MAG: hypothetical protein ACI3VK_02285 [Oscillospiraceae bacterium]